MSLPEKYLQMVSTLTEDATLRMELVEKQMPDPKPGQIIVRVEATPINPSDHGVMFGWSNMAAASKAGSDRKATNGIVDGHAYSVLEVLNDVAGTDVDLLLMRNPHGRGEMQDGFFDDDGPGWQQYPQIKSLLQPKAADDGMFYMTKQEFFRYFFTVYVCACDMKAFSAR